MAINLNNLYIMTYKEQLNSPKWQKKRLEIMERDGFQCRNCGSNENQLNVHHIIYGKEYENVWEYEDEILITLCKQCHEHEHEFNQYDTANSLLKNLIILSNKPLSDYDIEVDIYLLTGNNQFTKKEAIKHILLRYIRNL